MSISQITAMQRSSPCQMSLSLRCCTNHQSNNGRRQLDLRISCILCRSMFALRMLELHSSCHWPDTSWLSEGNKEQKHKLFIHSFIHLFINLFRIALSVYCHPKIVLGKQSQFRAERRALQCTGAWNSVAQEDPNQMPPGTRCHQLQGLKHG